VPWPNPESVPALETLNTRFRLIFGKDSNWRFIILMTTRVYSLSALSLLGTTLVVTAQIIPLSTPPMAPVPLSPAEQTIWAIKNPTSWMRWGGDLRVRNEYFNNTLTLDPYNPLAEQDYFRFRARIWAGMQPLTNVSVNVRLATEPREWMRPAGYTPYKGQSGLDWTEGIIDTLNVQWRNIGNMPVSVIVGRQDLMLGDGWLTGEGTPYDGSWSFYMDCARLTWELKDQHTTVEAIGICQTAKDDAWLPTINNQNRYLSEQNENGAILNVVNTSISVANLNGYFIYKHDDQVTDPKAPPRGDNGDIYTLGGRVYGLVANHWKYSVEGAYQFGQKQDLFIQYPETSTEYRNLSAFGLNSRFTYIFEDKLNNALSVSYEYMTGDDPKTSGDEMFDNLWGRYPRWSDIGLYSFASETRVGQQANYHRMGTSWAITPMKSLDFTANYYALIADQSVATRGATGLFGNSDSFRGHFFSAVLKYKFSPHLSGHLCGEVELPGNYYVHDEMLSFLRAEVLLTF
jgi:Alginate export